MSYATPTGELSVDLDQERPWTLAASNSYIYKPTSNRKGLPLMKEKIETVFILAFAVLGAHGALSAPP